MCLNHYDALGKAMEVLHEIERHKPEELPEEDEAVSIIAEVCADQEPDDGIWWYPHGMQRGESDIRDIGGNVKTRMLRERCEREAPIAPGKHHEREFAYEQAHREFQAEYLLELQRIEREESHKQHPEWWGERRQT
jgi:hypothetical protein